MNVALLRRHVMATPTEQRSAGRRDTLFVAGLIWASCCCSRRPLPGSAGWSSRSCRGFRPAPHSAFGHPLPRERGWG